MPKTEHKTQHEFLLFYGVNIIIINILNCLPPLLSKQVRMRLTITILTNRKNNHNIKMAETLKCQLAVGIRPLDCKYLLFINRVWFPYSKILRPRS